MYSRLKVEESESVMTNSYPGHNVYSRGCGRFSVTHEMDGKPSLSSMRKGTLVLPDYRICETCVHQGALGYGKYCKPSCRANVT